MSTATAVLAPGTPSITMTDFDLVPHGYVREEYFLSGTARSYAAGLQGPDGRWDATPAAERDFITRLVVVRPVDPARLSGTAVVEWLNVSGGRDAAPDWLFTHREIIRNGDTWVGVTAQRAGISGGGLREDQHLKLADPERYQPLVHPGDAFSFDIFGQACGFVRQELRPTTLLAIGESQAAIFLTTYVNAVDPHHQVVDGVLLHGRSFRGAWLDGTLWDLPRLLTEGIRRPALSGHLIRTDARVAVLVVQSETDLVLMGSRFTRQPDTSRFRLWEVAGAAHFDMYALRAAYADDGNLTADELTALLEPVTSPRGFRTTAPVNSGPQQHYVLQAALRALQVWAAGGPAPATADRLRTRPLQPLRFQRDPAGLVRGGVRSPFVEAPTAVLSGLGQSAPGFGMLFGSTRAFAPEALARRYPDGRDQYDAEFVAATGDSVTAGFLLADDQEEIIALGSRRWPA